MSEEIIDDDRAKLKQGLVMALKCLEAISSAAGAVIPIFSLAGSLIKVVQCVVDDEDICTLKREFGTVNQKLDKLSQQNHHTLLQIKKDTTDGQYSEVKGNLERQFQKFEEMVEAKPEHRERKKIQFENSYNDNKQDQNLNTLYECVVGRIKIFSQPILEVYLKHSQGKRSTMESLCNRLMHLFCMGLIVRMTYAAVMTPPDDVESLEEEWAEKMKEVQKKMQEALQSCK